MVDPSIAGISMELTLCHPSSACNFKLASRFLENCATRSYMMRFFVEGNIYV